VYVSDYDLEKSFIFEKTVEITSHVLFRFMYKHVVDNTWYTFRGMGVRKVSNNNGDL